MVWYYDRNSAKSGKGRAYSSTLSKLDLDCDSLIPMDYIIYCVGHIEDWSIQGNSLVGKFCGTNLETNSSFDMSLKRGKRHIVMVDDTPYYVSTLEDAPSDIPCIIRASVDPFDDRGERITHIFPLCSVNYRSTEDQAASCFIEHAYRQAPKTQRQRHYSPQA